MSRLEMPRLGQGTWYLGDSQQTRQREIDALRAGIEAGAVMIDTAEMYGEGRSELLVGEAIRPYDRENLFLVSKAYPHHGDVRGLSRSCEKSLSRLGTDYLDLYLLHWRGAVPLEETIEGMEQLRQRGMIRAWGVSNFDTDDMQELLALPGGDACAVDQVLYHLGSRGAEYSLFPLLRQHGVLPMAYCPLAQGGALRQGILDSPSVREVAQRHGASPAQILLAFALSWPEMRAVPKASSRFHAQENAAALQITLTGEDRALLDRAYPAPDHKTYLDII